MHRGAAATRENLLLKELAGLYLLATSADAGATSIGFLAVMTIIHAGLVTESGSTCDSRQSQAIAHFPMTNPVPEMASAAQTQHKSVVF
jgi:hypothetical protein